MRSLLTAALLAALLAIGVQGRGLAQDGGGPLADWALAEEASGKPGYWEVDRVSMKDVVAAPTPAPAPAPSEETTLAIAAAKSYTLDEVKKHKSQASAWIAVSGKVYDVTPWIDQHPGGPTAILSVAGTDATKKFSSQHGLDSFQAEMLADFYIGDLAGGAGGADKTNKNAVVGAAGKGPKKPKKPTKGKGKGKGKGPKKAGL